LRYSSSPGTPICRQRAPVARITVRDFSVAPFSSSTSISPPSVFAGVSRRATCRFITSTS